MEGRGFDETDDKGFYIGYISKGFVDLRFRTICKRKYIDCKIDVGGCLNSLAVYETINNKLKENYGEEFFKHFYKITLFGELPEDYLLDIKDIETKMDNIFYVKLIDKTQPFVNLKNIELGTDLKSIFIKKMLIRIKNAVFDEEKLIEEQALKIGLKVFMGEVKYNDN